MSGSQSKAIQKSYKTQKRTRLLRLLEHLEHRLLPAAFTPGDLVVFRIGDGTVANAPNNTGGVPAFLDEYTTTGTLVESIELPTTTSTGPSATNSADTVTNYNFVEGGSASEGQLNDSVNGEYLTFSGYNGAVNPIAGSPAAATAANVNRIIGLASYTGIVNTSISLSDFASTSQPRAVATVNGTQFWGDGGASYIRYISVPAGTQPVLGATSTQINTDYTNLRNISIFNSQLYASGFSGNAVPGIYKVGSGSPTGLPTSSIGTLASNPIINSSTNSIVNNPDGYFLAHLNPNDTGDDTLYVADNNGSGLQKYSLVNGTWVYNSHMGLGTGGTDKLFSITGNISASGTVTLYVTDSTSTGKVYAIPDTSGWNNTNGSFTGNVPSSDVIFTGAANTSIRGVAFAPQPATVYVSPQWSGYTTGQTITDADFSCAWEPACNLWRGRFQHGFLSPPRRCPRRHSRCQRLHLQRRR